jgi:hypothetical protein
VREPLGTAFRRAVLNDEILTLDVPEVTETLPECVQRWIRSCGRIARNEPPDPVHGRRLLRVRSKRRHEDGEGKGDEEPMVRRVMFTS